MPPHLAHTVGTFPAFVGRHFHQFCGLDELYPEVDYMLGVTV